MLPEGRALSQLLQDRGGEASPEVGASPGHVLWGLPHHLKMLQPYRLGGLGVSPLGRNGVPP